MHSPFGYGGSYGYQTDNDSGLILVGHRYYDPGIGRFFSVDPIHYGNNWYAYANNNPVSGIDPSGLYLSSATTGPGVAELAGIAADEAGITYGWGTASKVGTAALGIAAAASTNKEQYSELAQSIIRTSYCGQLVWRVYGSDGRSPLLGGSWSPIPPEAYIGKYRYYGGLPNSNLWDMEVVGIIMIPSGVTARFSLPLDGNLGGAPEYYIPIEKRIPYPIVPLPWTIHPVNPPF